MTDNRDHVRYTSVGLIPGLIVAGMGILFLLNNLNIVRVYDWWRLWPVIVIAIGLTKLIDSRHQHEKAGGAIMLIVGGVFLATNLGYVSLRIWQWWPLILIGAGLMMLLNRTRAGWLDGVRASQQGGNKPDAIAIFGGFKRQVSAEDFLGANYVAIFGGGEVDLRRAQIQGESAIVDVQAVFGGFELKVPTNWLVVNEVVGIFGGAADETMSPAPDAPGVRRLIVRGAAVFGGLSIKN
jgi:predicted membrane protein